MSMIELMFLYTKFTIFLLVLFFYPLILYNVHQCTMYTSHHSSIKTGLLLHAHTSQKTNYFQPDFTLRTNSTSVSNDLVSTLNFRRGVTRDTSYITRRLKSKLQIKLPLIERANFTTECKRRHLFPRLPQPHQWK